ncbi:MAG TPA: AMP-binding protein, partial [Clostridiales bacterium]|nr:AMP-binding protein [Clostridiales bacterium]
TQKTIDMLIDCRATAIACTPSYLLHVAEALERNGQLDKIALKYAICGAEPWTDEMRIRLENKLHIRCFDIYGLTEIIGPGVACDCEAHQGLHIWEDHFLPEIIDPITGEVLPEGSDGELVITTLTKEGMPMIRYRTKDLTSLAYETCSCGRTAARIQRFKGRSDDMLIIKGVNVFPSQVEAALLTIDGMTPNYFITVDRIEDQDVMEVAVELEDHFFSDEIADLERLTSKVKQVLKNAIGLNVKVRLVEPNSLEHSQGKTKHVLDKRKLY